MNFIIKKLRDKYLSLFYRKVGEIMNIQSKINKLIKALSIRGQIYLANKEQFFSKKSKKVCTIYKLFHLISIDEYNKLYPNDKKDSSKYENVKVEVTSTFNQIEILFELVNIYKEVGGIND